MLQCTRIRVLRLAAGVGLAAMCCCTSTGFANPVKHSGSVYRFDAGPSEATVDLGATALSVDSVYTPEAGFGWVQAPREGFIRKTLSRSRDAWTIDGVAGPRLEFQADIAPGRWSLWLWIETGIEDADKLELKVLGRNQSLEGQRFKPRTEPRRSMNRIYRVFQTVIDVDSKGLRIELSGGENEVRLLGVSLFQNVDPKTTDRTSLLDQLHQAGRYNSQVSLSELRDQIDAANSEVRSNAVPTYWLEQLELLIVAEQYYSMRGWEWAKEETGLGMFDRLYQAVMLLDGLLGAGAGEKNPLSERALYLRGRILYWLHKQMGGDTEKAAAERDLKRLQAQYPKDQLLKMYLGDRVDTPDPCDQLVSAPNAPAWSVAQREALCRLRQISHWWVNKQQAANGELGGKLGDDVEILRWWTPLVLIGDRTVQQGWEKLAGGILESKQIHNGYARTVADVEHASEFVADSMCMLTVFNDDPRYLDELAYSAKYFGNLWTGYTKAGHRHFRSAWFSSTAVEAAEPKGRDLEYNSRAVKAVRYLTARRPDPQIVKLLHEWSLAWVEAAMRTDKGKPKGIFPASVRFADEAFNGDDPTWYQANMYWDYFEWEHQAGSMMLDQLLYTYTLTRDKRLLEPMFLTLDLIRSEAPALNGVGSESLQKGSRAWVVRTLINRELFWSVVQQWRFMTGDTRWDDLILRHGSPYARYRLTDEESHVVDGLNYLLEHVRYNIPLMTSEAIHTDRVYAPGSQHLKAMLTGDGVPEDLSPYLAVSWEQTSQEFTALVSETGPQRLQATLYCHSPEDERIVMRIWQLLPGKYQLWVEAVGQDAVKRPIVIAGRGQRIPLSLPGQTKVRVRVEPQG